MPSPRRIALFLSVALSCHTSHASQRDDLPDAKLTEDWSRRPAAIQATSNSGAPSDAIVLLSDEATLQNWVSKEGPIAWEFQDDVLTVTPEGKDIWTKQAFGDCQLHLEWRAPSDDVGGENVGQESGNSGVFLMGRYEIQILNPYANKTYYNGMAGSVYKQAIPLVNPGTPPGTWQTYDILFTAPRFNKDRSLKSPAHITVLWNGVLVQHNFELQGSTTFRGEPSYKYHKAKEPLKLQEHGDRVSYRNIWIRPL